MKWIVLAALMVSSLAVGAANAQVEQPMRSSQKSLLGIPPVQDDGQGASPSTRAPSGADSPTRAPQTKRVKPPGAALGEAGPEDRKAAALERRQRELDRRIRSGICRGC